MSCCSVTYGQGQSPTSPWYFQHLIKGLTLGKSPKHALCSVCFLKSKALNKGLGAFQEHGKVTGKKTVESVWLPEIFTVLLLHLHFKNRQAC